MTSSRTTDSPRTDRDFTPLRAIGSSALVLTAVIVLVTYFVLQRPRDRYWVLVDLAARPWFNTTTGVMLVAAVLALLAWLTASGRQPATFVAVLFTIPATILVLMIASILRVASWIPGGYEEGVSVFALLAVALLLVAAIVTVCALCAVPIDRRAARRSAASAALRSREPAVIGFTQAGTPIYEDSLTTLQTNTMAILSLVCSFFVSILGIIFGHIALSQIKRTGEQGRGMAIAGLVLGYIGLAALVAWLIFLAVFLNSINSY